MFSWFNSSKSHELKLCITLTYFGEVALLFALLPGQTTRLKKGGIRTFGCLLQNVHKSLCLLNTCLSTGNASPSEHISLRRVCWCIWWSLVRDLSHAEDAFIQPHGSHHHLHWLHLIHFHGKFAHIDQKVTPTHFPALFCDVLPWVLIGSSR